VCGHEKFDSVRVHCLLRYSFINQYSIAFFDKHLRAMSTADPAKQLPGVSDSKWK